MLKWKKAYSENDPRAVYWCLHKIMYNYICFHWEKKRIEEKRKKWDYLVNLKMSKQKYRNRRSKGKTKWLLSKTTYIHVHFKWRHLSIWCNRRWNGRFMHRCFLRERNAESFCCGLWLHKFQLKNSRRILVTSVMS